VRPSAGPDLTVTADPDQLEQLFINVLRNAADARSKRRRPSPWAGASSRLGGHLGATARPAVEHGDLFVPFFTTKPGGSGHRAGRADRSPRRTRARSLENRTDTRGCRATLTCLPGLWGKAAKKAKKEGRGAFFKAVSARPSLLCLCLLPCYRP
jgi:hypothetical protein